MISSQTHMCQRHPTCVSYSLNRKRVAVVGAKGNHPARAVEDLFRMKLLSVVYGLHKPTASPSPNIAEAVYQKYGACSVLSIDAAWRCISAYPMQQGRATE